MSARCHEVMQEDGDSAQTLSSNDPHADAAASCTLILARLLSYLLLQSDARFVCQLQNLLGNNLHSSVSQLSFCSAIHIVTLLNRTAALPVLAAAEPAGQ